ncbi:helix-turn-helix domain-containing protein [uncultured Robinsoniella sp.]|uniref:helix-turn-helix domain-containing protein n=1 Tax=uncultured Robinsoniella sp. TaxID=904190 RepID=UPI00374EDA59
MTEEDQKRIFAKNLNYYIEMSGKQQREVANDLGLSPTTFNTWCVGKIVPGIGKIQKIADYFGIGKSDLVDDKLDSDPAFDAFLVNDMDTLDMVKKYYKLSTLDKKIVNDLIERLHQKNTEN